MLKPCLPQHPLQRPRQRGMSLVELMVGIAVGMLVVASATLLVANQLSGNRRLLLETQIQQDLRASADIVTRELRRAGSWGLPAISGNAVWTEANGSIPNPLTSVSPSSGTASQVDFSSSRTIGSTGPYGFRLRDGALETQLGSAGWQQLTDRLTMEVTAFTIQARSENPIQIICPRPCPDTTQDCWPTVSVRSFVVSITGRAVSDSRVVRNLVSTVRLRNDAVAFDPDLAGKACPE